MPAPGIWLPSFILRRPGVFFFHETWTNIVWWSSIGTQARAMM